MNITKRSFYLTITAVFGFLSFLIIAPAAANAQNAASAFPADAAGLAAYVKLSAISQDTFDRARQSLFESVESAAATYMIGVKKYSNDGVSNGYDQTVFHIYLGADGWLAVYLLKDQFPGQIANWREGAGLSDTMLKYAVDDALQKIGAAAAEPLKYYNFAYPDAKKMTFVRETMNKGDQIYSDDFSVLIPGTFYQGSYGIKCFDCAIRSWNEMGMNLYVDNSLFVGKPYEAFLYGNYDGVLFGDNKSHTVSLSRRSYVDDKVSGFTVLFYSPN